jgi:ElaB/YqjD/DUF883 family membrane-anchored ribosome-binding protein
MSRSEAKLAKGAIASAASRLEELIDLAQERLESLGPNIRAVASDAVDSSATFVRRDPWRAVAVGAITCLALAMFLRRAD